MSRGRWALSLFFAYHVAALTLAVIPEPLREHSRLLSLPVVRLLLAPYSALGFQQRWDMFGAPKTDDHYLRLTYVIARDGSGRPARELHELVLPAGRADSVRLRHDFRDKALINALDFFFDDRQTAPDNIEAVVRYFTMRASERYLSVGEHIVRAEAWYGSAPIPPPGERLMETQVAARLDALRAYYSGPMDRAAPDNLIARGHTEREADIIWILEYVEEL